MAARIQMGSGNGHGRRITDVEKQLQMPGRPRLVPVPKLNPPGRQDRRSQLQGGGASFIQQAYQKHPFLTGFGGTLVALKLIHGQKVTN